MVKDGKIEERASFDIVRYANCWEDADVLLQGLEVKEGGVYLSIASAGDNSLSMLSKKPALVLAVDISETQLACVELRKAAFLNLPYEQVLMFLGIRHGPDRITTYRKIRDHLSIDSRQFWDTNQNFIEMGAIHTGRFEGYFRLFRKWILPLIHDKNLVDELMKNKSDSDRAVFYKEKWNTWRWRMLFKIFFSRTVMGHLGRDPEFFKYVEGNVAARIMRRAEYALTTLPADENPYLEYILTGNFGNSLPFYLREDNFENIRNNLDKLVLFKGDLVTALQEHSTLEFDGFNLSDIFEYMSNEEYQSELGRVVDASRHGARLVYWNMLADRKYPPNLKDRIVALDDLAQTLFLRDKAFFYKALVIERVI
jgi:S-adenosylmethionine-diacylglycerol 3-amino-3-carboxypropyl transferase